MLLYKKLLLMTFSTTLVEFFNTDIYEGLDLTGLRLDHRTESAVLKLLDLNEEYMGKKFLRENRGEGWGGCAFAYCNNFRYLTTKPQVKFY
jgi:hypothetical protein